MDRVAAECLALLENAVETGDVLELEVAIAEAEEAMGSEAACWTDQLERELDSALLCAKSVYVDHLQRCKVPVRAIRVGVAQGNARLLAQGLAAAADAEPSLQQLMQRDVARGRHELALLSRTENFPGSDGAAAGAHSASEAELANPPPFLAASDTKLLPRNEDCSSLAARRKMFQMEAVAAAHDLSDVVEFVRENLAALSVPAVPPHSCAVVAFAPAGTRPAEAETIDTPRSSAPSRDESCSSADVLLPSNLTSASVSAASSRAPSPSPLMDSRPPPAPPTVRKVPAGPHRPVTVRVAVDWARFVNDESVARGDIEGDEKDGLQVLLSSFLPKLERRIIGVSLPQDQQHSSPTRLEQLLLMQSPPA
jgi:hypothetical protein